VPLSRERLFNDAELEQLSGAIAAATATADLLGRSRIHRRLAQARQYRERGLRLFAEPTDFSAFGDSVEPLPPEAALAYFRGLVPSLNVDPRSFVSGQERTAFTLARAADVAMLRRVQQAIVGALQSGAMRKGRAAVEDLLDAVGLSPRDPSYAEMMFR